MSCAPPDMRAPLDPGSPSEDALAAAYVRGRDDERRLRPIYVPVCRDCGAEVERGQPCKAVGCPPYALGASLEARESLRIAIETITTEEGEDPAEELYEALRAAAPLDAHEEAINEHRDRVNSLRGAWLAAREGPGLTEEQAQRRARALSQCEIDPECALKPGHRGICDMRAPLRASRGETRPTVAPVRKIGAPPADFASMHDADTHPHRPDPISLGERGPWDEENEG